MLMSVVIPSHDVVNRPAHNLPLRKTTHASALLQRSAKPIASPITPQQQRGDSGAGPYTRGSPASVGSGLGYNTRVVSTPEQLQRYMVSWMRHWLCLFEFKTG
jgi:hypothetical protein